MKKQLVLVRHAKSSWKQIHLQDDKRPIKKSGLRDIEITATAFQKEKIKPDVIISSPAVRAYDTAKIVAGKIKYKVTAIKKDPRIYESNRLQLMRVIREQADKINCIVLVGHDPSMVNLLIHLTDEKMEKLPTSGIACIEFNMKSWTEISKKKGKLVYFVYPKKLIPKEGDNHEQT